MNINLEKIKNIDFGKKISQCKNSLASNIVWIILIVALLVFLFAFHLWYKFVFDHSWSQSREQEYLNNESKGVELNEKKAEEVISQLEERRSRFQSDSPAVSDIFRLP